MRLRDQQVLVVAMVADQGEAFRAARQVVAEIAGDVAERHGDVLADQHLRPVLVAGGRIARVEMRAAVRTEPVDAVEIDARRAEVLDAERVLLLVAERGQVERDVVIDELAEIGEPGRYVRVVAGRLAGIAVDHRIGERLQLGVAHLERRQRREHAPEHAGVFVTGQGVEQFAGGVAPGDPVSRRQLYGVGLGLQFQDSRGKFGGRRTRDSSFRFQGHGELLRSHRRVLHRYFGKPPSPRNGLSGCEQWLRRRATALRIVNSFLYFCFAPHLLL